MSRTELIIVLSLTVFVIIVWVVTSIIRIKPSVEVDSKIQELLEPISPQFDQETLNMINNVSPAPRFSPIPRTPAPTPTSPSIVPIATEAAVISTASPSATPR